MAQTSSACKKKRAQCEGARGSKGHNLLSPVQDPILQLSFGEASLFHCSDHGSLNRVVPAHQTPHLTEHMIQAWPMKATLSPGSVIGSRMGT